MKGVIILFFLFISVENIFACRCEEERFELNKENLERYAFIAHVKVDSIYKSSIAPLYEDPFFYEAKFKIITHYKGPNQNHIFVNGGNYEYGLGFSMCDLEISPGEEWIIFAYADEKNNLRVDHCTNTVRYKNENGERNWQLEIGIWQLKLLNECFEKEEFSSIPENGAYNIYYPNGEVEVEANYQNYKLNGGRIRYYASGKIMTKDEFKDGLQIGKSIWYNWKGGVVRDYNFKNDHPIDTCFDYTWREELYKKSFYSDEGKMLNEYNYGKERLSSTVVVDYAKNEYISTYYYKDGFIRSINKYDTLRNIKHVREWSNEGSLFREYNYLQNDSFKTFEYKEWLENEELLKHYIYSNDSIISRIYENPKYNLK